jgi:hypothetical protein
LLENLFCHYDSLSAGLLDQQLIMTERACKKKSAD